MEVIVVVFILTLMEGLSENGTCMQCGLNLCTVLSFLANRFSHLARMYLLVCEHPLACTAYGFFALLVKR